MGGFDGRRGLMYQLAVNPEHRRQGNAIRLVDVLEDRLRTKGGFCYYLLFTKDNEAAISFYESSGRENMDDLYTLAKKLI